MFKYFQLKCIFGMSTMLKIAEIKFWFNDLIWFLYLFRTYIQKYVVENEIEEKIKYIFTLKKKKLQSFQENFSVPNVFFFHFIFKSILCTFNVPIGFFFLFSSIRISKCYKFCCRWAEYYSVLFIIKLNWRFFIKKKHFYTEL